MTQDTYLTEHQLAERLQCSPETLRLHRRRGVGCPWLKIGRLVRYRASDVDAWIASTMRGGRR